MFQLGVLEVFVEEEVFAVGVVVDEVEAGEVVLYLDLAADVDELHGVGGTLETREGMRSRLD